MRKFDEENAGYNALQVLYYLFERPIFTRELERCSVNIPTKNTRTINSQYRNDYVKKLGEVDIKIPVSSVLLEPVDFDKAGVTKLLNYILASEYDLKKYMVVNTNQKTLD
jgi:hypothetical protein